MSTSYRDDERLDSPFAAEDEWAGEAKWAGAGYQPGGEGGHAIEWLRHSDAASFESVLPETENQLSAAGVSVDVTVAVPAFPARIRSQLAPLLTAPLSQEAQDWNRARHDPASNGTRSHTSGVTVAEISAALDSYVDAATVRAAINAFNAANPGGAIPAGAARRCRPGGEDQTVPAEVLRRPEPVGRKGRNFDSRQPWPHRSRRDHAGRGWHQEPPRPGRAQRQRGRRSQPPPAMLSRRRDGSTT